MSLGRWPTCSLGSRDLGPVAVGRGQLGDEGASFACPSIRPATIREGRADQCIPAAAGLGGASSNAAAALAAANVAWKLHWPLDRLAETAAEIGSDAPFFLYGGAAVVSGRGERIEPINALPPWRLVVVKPAVGLSTAEVYRQCKPADHDPRGVRLLQPLRNALEDQRLDQAASSLWNRLQETAEELAPAVGETVHLLQRAGAAGCLMSGSGSSVFGLCRNTKHARRVAALVRQQSSGTTFAARLWRSPRRTAAA